MQRMSVNEHAQRMLRRRSRTRQMQNAGGTFRAAHLGRYASGDTNELLEGSLESFDVREFTWSVVFEFIPPLVNVPLVMLRERSVRVGLRVAVWRLFWPRPSVVGWPATLFLLLYTFPMHIMLWCCTLMWLTLPQVREEVDVIELIFAVMGYAVRQIIIGIKYGYFAPRDLDRMRAPFKTNTWSTLSNQRRLLGAGWVTPHKFTGFLEECFLEAQDQAKVDLSAMNFHLQPAARKTLEGLAAQTAFPIQLPPVEGGYESHENGDDNSGQHAFRSHSNSANSNFVAASSVMWPIIQSTFSQSGAAAYVRLAPLFVLIMTVICPLCRALLGIPLCGNTREAQAVLAMIVFLVFSVQWISALVFPLVAAFDFQRRADAVDMLGRVVEPPGVPFREIFKDFDEQGDEEEEEEDSGKLERGEPGSGENCLWLDLHVPENVFAWVLCRRVLRCFGSSYMKRCSSYLTLYFFCALFAIATLNFLIWSRLPHFIWSAVLCFVVFIEVSTIIIIVTLQASRINSAVGDHRLLVKREALIVEQLLYEMESRRRHPQEMTGRGPMHSAVSSKALDAAMDRFLQEEQVELSLLDASKDAPYGSNVLPSLPAPAVIGATHHSTHDPLATNAVECASLRHARKLLHSAEDLIGFEEEQMEPVQILGATAGPAVLSATVSVLIAGLLFAVDGYFTGKERYDLETGIYGEASNITALKRKGA